MLVSIFDYVLPILYHKDLHFHTQYHPFWPCYDTLDISLPLNGATQGIFTFQVIFMSFDTLN
jgi:hypothetical protein